MAQRSAVVHPESGRTLRPVVLPYAYEHTDLMQPGIQWALRAGQFLVGALALAPFAWLGLKIGNRIHVGLSQEQLRRAIGGVLVVSGIGLVLRALS